MTFCTNWSPEDDATLVRLWADGRSASDIGRAVGRSKNSVIGRAHRMNVAGRESPIQKREPGADPVRAPRVTGSTLAPLPSLAAVLPDWRRTATNANPPPPQATRDLVVRMLADGHANVSTAEAAGINIGEVRKIRKTIDVPKRQRVSDSNFDYRSHDKAGQELPRVFDTPTMDFATSERRYAIRWSAHRFQLGKQLERRVLTGAVPTQADIEAHIALRGVIRCPVAALNATTASISAADQIAIAAYQTARDEEWNTRNAPRNKRNAEIGRRAAAMRR